LEVIKQPEFSEDYEKYCMLKDKLTMSSQRDDIAFKCISCGSKAHMIESCPLVTYIPNRDLIIRRHNNCPLQKRGKNQRKNKRWRTFNNFKYIN
jgi:hypothetical protein